MAGLGSALARALEAVGKGALQKHNVETLGPDFKERLLSKVQEIRLRNAAEARAAELHKFEVGDQQAEQRTRDEARKALTIQAGGDEAAIPEYQAATAQDALDRTRRASDDTHETAQANLEVIKQKPELNEARLEIERQKAQAAVDRAVGAAERAAAMARVAELNVQIARDREDRQAQNQRDKPYVSEGTQVRMQGIGEAYRNITRLETAIRTPKAAEWMGPLTGQAWEVAIEKLGGTATTPEQQALYVELQAALTGRAFAQGGKALTPSEERRFWAEMPKPGDTLGLALQKLAHAKQVLYENAKGSYAGLSPAQKRTEAERLKVFGLSGADFPLPMSDADGMPPAPPTGALPGAPTQPGAPQAKPRKVWDASIGDFR